MSRFKVLFSVCCAMLAVGCDKEEDEAPLMTSATGSAQGAGGTKVADNQKDTRRTKKAARIEKPESARALQKFAVDWENLSGQSKGRDTLAKQRNLALAVLPELGVGDELVRFLDYLTERGAGDLRKELIG